MIVLVDVTYSLQHLAASIWFEASDCNSGISEFRNSGISGLFWIPKFRKFSQSNSGISDMQLLDSRPRKRTWIWSVTYFSSSFKSMTAIRTLLLLILLLELVTQSPKRVRSCRHRWQEQAKRCLLKRKWIWQSGAPLLIRWQIPAPAPIAKNCWKSFVKKWHYLKTEALVVDICNWRMIT